jgi:hypothetical protein
MWNGYARMWIRAIGTDGQRRCEGEGLLASIRKTERETALAAVTRQLTAWPGKGNKYLEYTSVVQDEGEPEGLSLYSHDVRDELKQTAPLALHDRGGRNNS